MNKFLYNEFASLLIVSLFQVRLPPVSSRVGVALPEPPRLPPVSSGVGVALPEPPRLPPVSSGIGVALPEPPLYL